MLTTRDLCVTRLLVLGALVRRPLWYYAGLSPSCTEAAQDGCQTP